MSFMDKVRARQVTGCHLCVGLDPVYDKIPKHLKQSGQSRADVIFAFNKAIIDNVKPFVCAFKPNAGFYSPIYGDDRALIDTVNYIHDTAPAVPAIVDSKRTDIGKSNVHYVAENFDKFHADATTVNPYFGGESLEPFLENPDKGIIVLCRTSNKGAAEFQNRLVGLEDAEIRHLEKAGVIFRGDHGQFKALAPLYQLVAIHFVSTWNKNNNCGLVVGATAPEELAQVRRIVGDMQILIPGIGAQGGDLEATVKAGADSTGAGMIINSSSGITFAFKGEGEDFAEVAATEAKKLNDAIISCLANRN